MVNMNPAPEHLILSRGWSPGAWIWRSSKVGKIECHLYFSNLVNIQVVFVKVVIRFDF